jgi:hypothetical protein
MGAKKSPASAGMSTREELPNMRTAHAVSIHGEEGSSAAMLAM